MLQIDDTIISLDLLDKKFICDLAICKGECCVEGEAGAPLELDEVEQLKEVLPVVWDNIPRASQAIIKEQGVSYIDSDGDNVTSLVNGEECVFVYKNEKGYYSCAVEKAFLEGKISFRKPISCYLYPVRVDEYKNHTAVNYHQWHICECARVLGEKEGLEIYKFLKEPLIAKFGEAWYEQLEIAAAEIADMNKK